GRGRDLDELEPIVDEQAQVFADEVERVAERDVAAGRVAVEADLLLQDLEQLDGGGPIAAEEVGLDEADLRELADAGELQVQAERLAAAEQVLLLDLAGEQERLLRREAGAELERAGRALGHLVVDHDAIGRGAVFFRELDLLEVAERHHALLRALDQRLVVQL